MTAIFVNYRVSEDPGTAILIARELAEHFGTNHVFRDSDSIQPGDDFEKRLFGELFRADVLLAVIGPRWIDARTPTGEHALDQPDDWVRREIAAALQRNILVIPILVQKASVLKAAKLPADLQPLATRQYVRIDHRSMNRDIANLIDKLEQEFPHWRRRDRSPVASDRADRPNMTANGHGQIFFANGNMVIRQRKNGDQGE